MRKEALKEVSHCEKVNKKEAIIYIKEAEKECI